MSTLTSNAEGTIRATHSLAATAVPAASRLASILASGAAALFLILLALLHLLKPEFDPSWRMISEYAIGRHGWLMALAFYALTVAYFGLAVALAPCARGVAGRLGLVLLIVSAVGTALAGTYTTDPITIAADAVSDSGRMHGLGFTLGVPSFPIAASLLTWALWRRPEWATARRGLLIATGLIWLSIALFAGAMATQFTGAFGPDVQIGWQNRFLIVAYTIWVLVAGWQVARPGR